MAGSEPLLETRDAFTFLVSWRVSGEAAIDQHMTTLRPKSATDVNHLLCIKKIIYEIVQIDWLTDHVSTA